MTGAVVEPAALTDDDRIKEIKGKLFLRFDFADAVMAKLDELVAVEEVDERQHLIVTGESGAGKSTIVKRFWRSHLCPSYPQAEADHVPVIYVRMPSRPTLSGLVSRILTLMMQTRKASTPEGQLVESAQALMRSMGTRVLIIDEMQDLEKARPTDKDVIKNFIKSVGEECDLSLVLVGMPELLPVIGAVRQISRRFDILACPPWKYDERGANLLHNIEPLLLLARESGLAEDRRLGEWIFGQAEGTIGDTLKILRLAAEHAIRSGEERITLKVLNAVDFVRSSQRATVANQIMKVRRQGK